MDRFKFIKGFEKYLVCSNGHIYSTDFNHSGKFQILKESLDKDGYPYVRIYNNKRKYKKMVHRLVAEAFILNPNSKPQVNHKDGNKQNNKLDNLEWVTCKENIIHCYKVLNKKPTEKMIKDFTKRVKGENNVKSKINYQIAQCIKNDRKKGKLLKELSKKYNLSVSQISAICLNKFWIHDNPELLENK